MFETANAGFAQIMYEEYLRDPSSVSEQWRRYFEKGIAGLPPENGNGAAEPVSTPTRSTPQQIKTPGGEAPSAPSVAPEAIPITGPAAKLVANMNESRSMPTATSFRELPVSVLESRRRELNNALRGAGRSEKVSFTHLIGFAAVNSAARHTTLTSVYQEVDGAPYRRPGGPVHLGIAVDVERKDGTRGLVVPVIRDAAAKSFAEFHSVYESLVEKARANKLLPDAFVGANLTLTNPGGIGTVASVPRLMPGQGCIVAVGAIDYPPAFSDVSDDRLRELGVSKVMTVTSTYDHRIIQGAESGEFLRTLDELLQGDDQFYEGVFQSLGLSLEAALPAPPPGRPSRAGSMPVIESQADLYHVAAAMALVKAHRTHGHLAARLDPLGSEPIGDPALDPVPLGLTPEVMATIPTAVLRISTPGQTLAEALPRLHEAYCGTMAYELEHISNHGERVWLRQMIESGHHRQPLSPEDQKWLYGRLIDVEAFERFLHKAYLGQKRFSIEGVDMLVPMLDLTIELAARQGARHVVVGMAHRGRLNVLAHTVGRPYETIFAEFEGAKNLEGALGPDGGTGDVKYHLGADGAYKTRSGKVLTVTLSPNPSHLEFVSPVVDGRARAEQTNRKGREAHYDPTAALPVIIHGDAAFAGQGVVSETLNLGALLGYRTGGTIHLITNNQIGFTTDMGDARSTRHASDLAKGFDVPIIHVNADDAEACLSAIRLAMAYRERFQEDVLIDLVGYRRHGHNEGDEPSYTQPLMYERIRQLPTVRQQYAALLANRGLLTEAEAEHLYEAGYQRLTDLQQAFKSGMGKPAAPEPIKVLDRSSGVGPETALEAGFLRSLNEQLLTWPEGFTVNPKLAKQLERRRTAMGSEGGIDWAHAEALALAGLLVEGVPIRLTGQDTERGTFSQRHLVLHDAVTGTSYTPLKHLASTLASLELHNSPLSELATLGFEYGYSAAAPETLVIWEAQFGDFVNGAQVVIDQFIVSGLSKWGLTTRLTLLLPHGYEGQGPEHSSARVERFLQLCAEGNIRVANPTTPAQYFHLLRRQAKRNRQRPLIILTPKSLLRLPQATSRLEDLSAGHFQPVLDDPVAQSYRDQVKRLILCSGKVYYDLQSAAAGADRSRMALVRLEQLYSFPEEELRDLTARYPNLNEVVWVQEEPRNMGAWTYVEPRLRAILPPGLALRYSGRPERASPAEGYPSAHALEQKRITEDALRSS
ncbi:MAG TPA: multifunctional oxoglutarate decarboxylase/oxoglutarate dehydrogenase thiamine pyrophosphate-binding subunit/dihydrolipoyllysine-residue succinyltransferase subunit [Gemmatimonadales bacterium]|nr:multifunctional oxoglutarate decarboxylase/oxoglutarate dehydrogenase thiamine pyrophosphate-binding subunit/dihydrolipoyllysine-residue succinyltransferase subunit [Gemmatimonadales bacterium]